ncbi:MAG: FADH(2)-oxidizing methylenetetrahydrofolate--tRNA-(uracil(54)-C(5))-methyltransferase TrmFO [Geminocystis sp.]|nr:FADH(2)-oxidizing methylenetetrahydrofolate--tRNA-(uracil(54)-C(5))-methyltransferase TrmFO [Geminocystis sp.]MCS7147544.1 FADH(2)-oxidizing methylenetetrahydrofolate--tRNA-(uracil(54)-C(5))-methyltransferase TrmFO [Geminocystis sp.]MDW8115237.1 FADH(2)-oxidizing methylenetetrahydrofolate--tRNA-(uracil(54)-C(5))-methyltransferase TrmFO [Geminocystis sp.]MDW8464507.1 FADH(2)-oxidizing methylenetetrahydrofolate--tRNA-(uracil(54)-C(5))-methyltransferase TrmFO [Geminocystis sp.]HIK38503.1 FADH(2
MSGDSITVIGGGLAGTEAAWQIAKAGIPVTLYEMRPVVQTPAHHSGELAELVCSNSFGAESIDRASGLLHEELRRLGSLVIQVADRNRVPAGGALAVDRVRFSRELTDTIASHPLITLKREEVKTIPGKGIVVLATGPLTAETLARELQNLTGMEYLNFFDAASPIILGESINRDIAFLASRYGKGEAAYLNCPMDREQYLLFWRELCNAQQTELKDFERENATFFEACLPIEELARRGENTMRFGPLKPVGIVDPRFPDRKYYAVVQLRPEDKEGQLWNMVGFQTNLRWGEQKRVFRLIPGLENAEFVRFGVMHKNIFLNAPKLLLPTLQFKNRPTLFACGQLVGTEGYTAAVAGGWLAGTNAARMVRSLPLLVFPRTTMLGALIEYITSADSRHFQPMPPNFGILPPLDVKVRSKPQRYRAYASRALSHLDDFISTHKLPLQSSRESVAMNL